MSRDRIRLSRISLYGCHGVTPAEREIGRPFEVDVELVLDLSAAADTDDLGTTVDYTAVCDIVQRIHDAGPHHLLEAMAGRMANEILGAFPVDEVTVRVRKPHPPVGAVVGAAEVEITRQTARDSRDSEERLA
jgi:dihydroneopterin aldolase